MIHMVVNNIILSSMSSAMTYLSNFSGKSYRSTVISKIKHFDTDISKKIAKCILKTIYKFQIKIQCIPSPAVSLYRIHESC